MTSICSSVGCAASSFFKVCVGPRVFSPTSFPCKGAPSFDMRPDPQSWTRRSFIGTAALAAMGHVVSAADAAPRKKIALITTVVYRRSHGQHFLDRHALGYTWGGQWQQPRVDLASIYVDQFPSNDLARSRAQRYQVPIFPSIADALTLGTGRLAVDGVVIVGEHGNYPQN